MPPALAGALALLAIGATLAIGVAPAEAAKPCGRTAVGHGLHPRVAVIGASCEEAAEVLDELYDQITQGVKPDSHFRWHVGAFRCFTGLGSSEAWCHSRGSWVFSSTRPEDHPATCRDPNEQRGAYWRRCGSQNHPGAGWYHVKAHNVHCGTARAVARHLFHSLNPAPSPLGFSCHSRQTGIEFAHAACRRVAGSRVQKVRFIYGA